MNTPARQAPAAIAPTRLASIDAYRGLVMLLMMAEVLELRKVAAALPGSEFWKTLAYHQSHVAWVGCSLHDLIQPSFSFLVGVALPFSIASRQAKGQATWQLLLHAAWRGFLLAALGIWLRSIDKNQTNFTFDDTLTQIGFGYFPLFLLGFTRQRWHWVALVAILVGYWGAFALYPLPAADFYSMETVGVPPDWKSHFDVSQFAAHWNKNSNLAWRFDVWWMNLFPREKPWLFHPGGYATLSFIPTLATMILGLIAGTWMQRATPGASAVPTLTRWRVVGLLLASFVVCLGVSLAIDYSGLCPIVKRIWTPSWVLYSGAWCFLFLAAFYVVLDIGRLPYVAFPLQVIGANSIAAYLIAHLFENFLKKSLHTHLGEKFFAMAGSAYEPLLMGGAILLIYWLILLWMYRRRIFLKV